MRWHVSRLPGPLVDRLLRVEIVKLVDSSFLLQSTSEHASIFTSSLSTKSSELYLVSRRHFLSFTGVSVLEKLLSTFLF